MKNFNYERRKSSIVRIGDTPLGGEYPIRVQSMTNTSTMDTNGSVEQCLRIIDAGGEYVRLTAQGVREAENLKNIREELNKRGYHTPLIADIHFNPKAADSAARTVEKVRINPGNYIDPVKTFAKFEYTDEEYAAEIEKIKDRFIPFLNICKENNTAIRIGVNHGSLSDRIMSRYGDTPRGMVESCMEFLRICVAENFSDVVLSIKASVTSVMVRTVRLLVDCMEKENMFFPLHLGVTEAGDGEDGRIKSAVGIGTLLMEGIGDTIRVSLSENPESEIPVCRKIVDHVKEKEGHPFVSGKIFPGYHPFDPEKRKSFKAGEFGGGQPPVVIENTISPLFNAGQSAEWKKCDSIPKFLELGLNDLDDEMLFLLKQDRNTVVIMESNHLFSVGEQKAFLHRLWNEGADNPIIIKRVYNETDVESLQIKAAIDCSVFFLDMLADGIWIQNTSSGIPPDQLKSISYGILQATGRLITKTEYVSCPSCGRTLFDLQSTIKKIKAATNHLKGLKIGIMGCIVNGPGEMADADYGYVGAGPGQISLYKGKECVEKNIPAEQAVESLINLIKKHGDWKEADV
ncbi:MAG: (E)-4-hydroxy-3-methylbut-2-enyl-diphosphate synthase [Dysgonamonadaceae bacterium]|jgi:(E)-4-hydroxy-3-methylbut-2-enyl-diphosphate synthase|nr:(E)-4-hydroxy-3-methylbut-2-enyl-diphosphate synthase [Dysgonamonadaceae bacterium]